MSIQVIEVNESVFAGNDRLAEETRQKLKKEGTFLLNVMASPGAGKTSVLLRTIGLLKDRYRMGVMEADIDATVDAEKMQANGVRSIQVHTGGECAMNADMTRQALEEFHTEDLDLLFLENVGNLVCPAEEDVGACRSIEILSVPEGDDKPLKYPLMFSICDVVIINKIDVLPYFDFDVEKCKEYIKRRNPNAKVFMICAKTGEGVDEWANWLLGEVKSWRDEK